MDQIEEKDVVRVSATQLSEFERCSLKWKFQYIDKVVRIPSVAAVTGTFVHSVLEGLYELDPENRNIDSAKAVAKQVWEEFKYEDDYNFFDFSESEARSFRINAWTLVQRLWELENPDKVDVKANEMRLEYELGEGLVFIGFADRLDYGKNGVEVVDYKTGKRPADRFSGEKKEQIRLYALAVKEITNDDVTKGKLLFLGGDSPGILTVGVNDKALSETRDKLIAQAVEIKRAKEGDLSAVNPSPQVLCGWCDFIEHCPEGQKYLKHRVNNNDFNRMDAPALKLIGLT